MSDAGSVNTIITNEPMEGWTFTPTTEQALQDGASTQFPTTTPADDGWGIPPAATTTDGWNHIPAAPSPPLSAVEQTNDHASLHWTACYDDECTIHRQAKDNAYYPRRANGRHRRNHQRCDCQNAHPFELAEVIRNRHLNPRKACQDWRRGKRVCHRCRFLVNMDNHENRCQTTGERAPLAELPTEGENAHGGATTIPTRPAGNQENEEPVAAPTTNEPRENTELLRAGFLLLHENAARTHDLTRQILTSRRGETQAEQERHEATRQQLQQVTHVLEGVLRNQRFLVDHAGYQLRQSRRPAPGPQRSPIYRRRTQPHDLAGASVWTGDVLSQTWRDRLVGAAAGAILTIAGLWFALVTGATIAYIFRG
jgi:hypothetical protein